MDMRNMIILSMMAVMLIGCIGSVSAGFFDFLSGGSDAGSNEFNAGLLESNISWNDTIQSIITMRDDSGDQTYSNQEFETNFTGYVKVSLNDDDKMLDNIENDTQTVVFSVIIDDDAFSGPIEFRASGNNVKFEKERNQNQTVLTMNFNTSVDGDLKLKQGQSQIKSGNITIIDDDNKSIYVLF